MRGGERQDCALLFALEVRVGQGRPLRGRGARRRVRSPDDRLSLLGSLIPSKGLGKTALGCR